MREMTLKDIQDVSLDILTHFHEYCEANNFRYSLAFGTMLGAERHHGFIPWDDDVDVFMPRPDFDRLMSSYIDSEEYALFSHERGGAYQAIGRLCDMKRTRIITRRPWLDKETGVWIDIFPLDGCENDIDSVRSRYNKMQIDWHKEWRIRRTMNKINNCKSFDEFWREIACFVWKWITRPDINKLIEIRIDQCLKHNWEESNYVANLAHYSYKFKKMWHKEDFETTIDIDFEGIKFKVFKGYKTNLLNIYGDYMQLPPEKDRVVRHGFNNYYWQ